MQLDHEFTVPVPAAQAWPVLLDISRIAPCMPGATITKIDGDDFEGTVKVKVGPITVTYGGSASFLEKDESERRAVIEARGRETRGTGTASARVIAQLHDEGPSTRVVVSTDLAITGKPAQFGRGVMSDVGAKLLGRFADCLSEELAAAPAPAGPAQEAALPAGGVIPPDGPPARIEPIVTPSAAGTGPATAVGEVEAPGGGTPGDRVATPAAAAADAGPDPAAVAAAMPADAPAATAVTGSPVRREAEAIDLMEAAGPAVVKRLAPVLGIAALLAVLVAVLRRKK